MVKNCSRAFSNSGGNPISNIILSDALQFHSSAGRQRGKPPNTCERVRRISHYIRSHPLNSVAWKFRVESVKERENLMAFRKQIPDVSNEFPDFADCRHFGFHSRYRVFHHPICDVHLLIDHSLSATNVPDLFFPLRILATGFEKGDKSSVYCRKSNNFFG